jgi:hypothetical protein
VPCCAALCCVVLCRAVLQMYLTDVEEGGETVFPHVPRLAQQTAGSGWTACGMQVRVCGDTGLMR